MVRKRMQPVRGFVDMMSEMERIRNVGRHGYDVGQPGTHTDATPWVPTTDIVSCGNDLVLETELAGVPATDIDISVSDGVLTISGERGRRADDDTVASYLRERYYGQFRRSMVLPEGVDQNTISARFDNGVVIVTVPGAANAPATQPHHVPIVEM